MFPQYIWDGLPVQEIVQKPLEQEEGGCSFAATARQLDYQSRIVYARAKFPTPLSSGPIIDHVKWKDTLKALHPNVNTWIPRDLLNQAIDKSSMGSGCPVTNGVHWVKEKFEFYLYGKTYGEKVETIVGFLDFKVPLIAVIEIRKDYSMYVDLPYLGTGDITYRHTLPHESGEVVPASHAVVLIGHYTPKHNIPFNLEPGTTYFIYQDYIQPGYLRHGPSRKSLYDNQIGLLHPNVVKEAYCGISHIDFLLMTPEEAKIRNVYKESKKVRKQDMMAASNHCKTNHTDLEILLSLSDFGIFGKLFKSSAPVELKKAKSEYTVNVVKHIFDEHVVFRFNITDKIPHSLLENVGVIVDASNAKGFSEVATKYLSWTLYDTTGMTYVAFKKPRRLPALGKFSTTMTFITKQADQYSGQAVDVEYKHQLEIFEVVTADYIRKEVGVSSFRISWESMNKRTERVTKHRLATKGNLIEAVIRAVTSFIGMEPCEGTAVVPSNSRSHTCILSFVYIGNVKVLVRLFFKIADLKGVPVEPTVELAVRSEDEAISNEIHGIITSVIIAFL